ncbi:MAG: DUF4124 domain-containing protein [Nitrospiraceae bacterium]
MNERASWSLFWLWLAVSVVCPWGACDAAASKIYSYTDDQGNFVASDSLENVPERYRGRAKVREVQDSGAPDVRPTAPPSGFEAFLLALAERLPKVLTIPGTNAFQTIVLVAGGLAAVLMLAGMHLSANPAVRLLMKCMLGFLVVGAMYLMYFSDMGERATTASGQPASSGTFMQKARDSAKTQEAIHQQRAKEIESLEQPGQVPK